MNCFPNFFKFLILTSLSIMIISIPNPAIAAKKVTKSVIAVGDIEYRAKDSSENKRYRAYGKGVREDTRAFVDMLTTALVKTRKFKVIERDRLDEIFKEQGLSIKGFTTDGYQGRKFNLRGVDFIMTGAITEFGQQASSFRVKGFATGDKTTKMAVDIRVLNIHSGEIEIAETVRGSESAGSGFSLKGFTTGRADDAGAALGKVSRKVASDVANLIVSAIFPIKVLMKTKKGIVIVNYGNGFLRKGDVLEIFSEGEVLIDPDTKERLGTEEEFVGRITITSAHAKFSKAKINKESSPIEKGMIARRTKKSSSGQKAIPSLWGNNEN